MNPQSLSNAKVEHNLFGPTGNGIGSYVAVQSMQDVSVLYKSSSDKIRSSNAISPLNFPPLAPFRIAQATKDLTRLPGAELKGNRALRLEACNRAS